MAQALLISKVLKNWSKIQCYRYRIKIRLKCFMEVLQLEQAAADTRKGVCWAPCVLPDVSFKLLGCLCFSGVLLYQVLSASCSRWPRAVGAQGSKFSAEGQ